MNTASVTYNGRTYHAFAGRTIEYAEGADIKRAFSVPQNAVPPVVRAQLLTLLTGTKHVAVEG